MPSRKRSYFVDKIYKVPDEDPGSSSGILSASPALFRYRQVVLYALGGRL